MFAVGIWTASDSFFFHPPGHANCYFSMVIHCSIHAPRGLFPCSSFMWFNEVSGEWLSLCLLSCNSSVLIAWFCLAGSLTRCWTYVFVSPLAEQIVLFVTRSSSATHCRAGAAWTSSWVCCLFRLQHRGADHVARTQTKWDWLSFKTSAKQNKDVPYDNWLCAKERERPSEREKQGPRPQPLITWFHPRNQETAKYGDFSCDTQTVPLQ